VAKNSHLYASVIKSDLKIVLFYHKAFEEEQLPFCSILHCLYVLHGYVVKNQPIFLK